VVPAVAPSTVQVAVAVVPLAVPVVAAAEAVQALQGSTEQRCLSLPI